MNPQLEIARSEPEQCVIVDADSAASCRIIIQDAMSAINGMSNVIERHAQNPMDAIRANLLRDNVKKLAWVMEILNPQAQPIPTQQKEER